MALNRNDNLCFNLYFLSNQKLEELETTNACVRPYMAQTPIKPVQKPASYWKERVERGISSPGTLAQVYLVKFKRYLYPAEFKNGRKLLRLAGVYETMQRSDS